MEATLHMIYPESFGSHSLIVEIVPDSTYGLNSLGVPTPTTFTSRPSSSTAFAIPGQSVEATPVNPFRSGLALRTSFARS